MSLKSLEVRADSNSAKAMQPVFLDNYSTWSLKTLNIIPQSCLQHVQLINPNKAPNKLMRSTDSLNCSTKVILAQITLTLQITWYIFCLKQEEKVKWFICAQSIIKGWLTNDLNLMWIVQLQKNNFSEKWRITWNNTNLSPFYQRWE